MKNDFPFHQRKRNAESLFLSGLDYGNVIHGKAAVSTLKTLNAVYHTALRFITNEPYNPHHCTPYQNVVRLSLAVLFLNLFIYETLLEILPPCI